LGLGDAQQIDECYLPAVAAAAQYQRLHQSNIRCIPIEEVFGIVGSGWALIYGLSFDANAVGKPSGGYDHWASFKESAMVLRDF
jgi:hypothetical protein